MGGRAGSVVWACSLLPLPLQKWAGEAGQTGHLTAHGPCQRAWFPTPAGVEVMRSWGPGLPSKFAPHRKLVQKEQCQLLCHFVKRLPRRTLLCPCTRGQLERRRDVPLVSVQDWSEGLSLGVPEPRVPGKHP